MTNAVAIGLAIAALFKTNATVAVSWDTPTNPIVAGLNIYYGGASGIYTNKTRCTNTVLVLTNLLPNQDYFFAATTFSAAGAESAMSAETNWSYSPILTGAVVTVSRPVGSNVVLQAAPDPRPSAPWLAFITNAAPFSVVLPVTSPLQFYRAKLK